MSLATRLLQGYICPSALLIQQQALIDATISG